MTKEERIERYGIEAYERQLALSRKRALEWRKNNPERDAENHKKYYMLHKEEKAAYDKKWREENKERKRLINKIYREEHKEEIKAQKRKYFNDIYKTKKGRASVLVNSYNRDDILKGLSISENISSKWIIENIFSGQKCIYCGDGDWTHLGCDRIDNTKPHTPDNVVCACGVCNGTRSDKFSVEEFKLYRSLHPRECDIFKNLTNILGESGIIKKRCF